MSYKISNEIEIFTWNLRKQELEEENHNYTMKKIQILKTLNKYEHNKLQLQLYNLPITKSNIYILEKNKQELSDAIALKEENLKKIETDLENNRTIYDQQNQKIFNMQKENDELDNAIIAINSKVSDYKNQITILQNMISKVK